MSASSHCKLALLCVLAAQSVFAAEKWVEIRSPHFRVLTNGSESSARRVAREFEQIRSIFATEFPGYRLESGAPLLIFAPSDESTARQIAPEVFDRKKEVHPSGFYRRGWERQYALVRLDAIGSDPMVSDAYSIVYFDYVASLLDTNLHWLPVWLATGLASFYQYTRFEQNRILIGAPPRNRGWTDLLARVQLIPTETFIHITRGSEYFRDGRKNALFFAQAWAMAHFLYFGPGMEQGKKLDQFLDLLQQGMEQNKAFREIFGSFQDLDKSLNQYAYKFAFTTGELPNPPKVSDKDFVARDIPPAELEAEWAAYCILSHRWKEMRELTEAALKDDPKLGLAHEDMGYFQFNEGKNEEALREFTQAFELDGKLYRSLFAKTMISPEADSRDPGAQEAFHDDLLKVLDLNPAYAPALVELAKMYVRQGDYAKALGLARKAEQLEPSRAGYHLLSGQILLRLGRPAEAASYAAYVANRWEGPDHDEAIELWNQVPVEQRPADTLANREIKLDWQTAEGAVMSVSCQEKSFTIVLAHDHQSLSFHTAATPFGFSDTYWWGRDHFTPCFHVTGMRAVVHYKPSSDKAYTGDLVNVGFRDDLPALQAKSETQADVPEKKN